MAATIRHHGFSEAKQIVLNYRKVQQITRKALIETGAWFLAFFTFFAMIEGVLWIVAIL